MKKYNGQSLAIVFVLLIIGSVIGFAIYARMVRESERAVDERASSEANELAETAVGLIGTSNYQSLKGDCALSFLNCEEDDLSTEQGCRLYDLSLLELEEFFMCLGLEVDFSSYNFDFEPEEGYCTGELVLRQGLANDEVTIEQDNAYSIFFGGVDWDSCDVSFYMTGNGVAEGFVMSTFYGQHDAGGNIVSYKDYEFSDILGFSYSDREKWESYSSGNQALSFPSAYPGLKGGAFLHEVRFKSLSDSSNLRWEASGCPISQYLIMEVGMTCGGKYVGKSFMVPSEVFAPPMFDYVLFNGQGELRPEPIPTD